MRRRLEAWALSRLLLVVLRMRIGCEWIEPRILRRLRALGDRP